MRAVWWRSYDMAPGRLRKGTGHWGCNHCRDRDYKEYRYYRPLYKFIYKLNLREEYAWPPSSP